MTYRDSFFYHLILAAKKQNSGAEKMEPLNSHSKYNESIGKIKFYLPSPLLRHFLYLFSAIYQLASNF
jgi:hypothetical protein